jgi:hypothetical protein
MSERYQLWPAAFVGGQFSVPDEILRYLWRELVRTGKDTQLFYNGGVDDEGKWLSWIKATDNYPVLVIDTDVKKIVCIAWLNNAVDGAALAHFCMMGFPRPEIGETVLRYWSGTGALSVLVGFTPENYTAAIKYAKRIGFVESGYIPSMCNMVHEGRRVGAVVTTYLVNREDANGWRKKTEQPAPVAV